MLGANGRGASFEGDGNALTLDSGDGCTTLFMNIPKPTDCALVKGELDGM